MCYNCCNVLWFFLSNGQKGGDDVTDFEKLFNENKDFIFSLKMKSKWYGTIKIILKKNYLRDELGLVNIHNYAKLEFDGKRYSGSVSLNPNFYLLAKTRKKVRDEKKKNQELVKASKKCIMNNRQTPKPSASIYTNYTYNNVAKPFYGGKVSPK